MFDIQNYTSFLAAIFVFQLIPGAGTLAILNATARNGVGAGLGAVLGTIVGDFLNKYVSCFWLLSRVNLSTDIFRW